MVENDKNERRDLMTVSEKAFWTHEVAKQLLIGESTLRKWSLALEEQGYKFVKGEQESRAYIEGDIKILFKLKEEIRNKNKPVKEAVKTVLESIRTTDVHVTEEERTPLVPDEVDTRTPIVPIERLVTIEDIREVLNEELNKREKQRDQLLIEALRNGQENKKMLLEMKTMFEIAATREKKKWWQFWK